VAIVIERPTSEADLEGVRALMRAFVAWHREEHVDQLHLVDAYFDGGGVEAELATLPGKYAPPEGELLLASVDGEAAGCVALRALGGGACEMKRMFVYPRFQGLGLGRALGEAVVEEARRAGHRVVRLDTSRRQEAALGLYRRLGFREVDPYYELPRELEEWLVFMELQLR
jgi:GNAT superfamily N-acetyltransferase